MADHVERRRHARRGALELPRRGVVDREPLSSVDLGPVDAGVPGVVDPALPLDGVVDEVRRTDRAVVGRCVAAMLGDPGSCRRLVRLDVAHSTLLIRRCSFVGSFPGTRDPNLLAGVDSYDALGRLDRHARRRLDRDGARVLVDVDDATVRRAGAVGT